MQLQIWDKDILVIDAVGVNVLFGGVTAETIGTTGGQITCLFHRTGMLCASGKFLLQSHRWQVNVGCVFGAGEMGDSRRVPEWSQCKVEGRAWGKTSV